MTLIDKYNIIMERQQTSGEQHADLTTKYIKTFREYVPPEKYPLILDIGVGEGPQELDQLKEAGYDVYSINIQEWRAKQKHSYVMDMNDQRFPPSMFDGAYSTQVI